MSKTKLTDEDLMFDFQRGDQKAFEELVRRHQNGVYNYVNRFLGNAQIAEEVFQEAFIKVYRAADSYRVGAKFTTWLYTIVRNQSIDHIRRSKLRQALSLDDKHDAGDRSIGDTVASEGPGPDEKSLQLEIEVVLEDALTKLNADQREVFLLREKEGFKFEEIAEMTGTSVNTVKSRMRYALDSLKRILKSSRYRDLLEGDE